MWSSKIFLLFGVSETVLFVSDCLLIEIPVSGIYFPSFKQDPYMHLFICK